MVETTPTTPKPSGSLSDRVTQPTSTLNAASSSFTPAGSAEAKTSWADEVASPAQATDDSKAGSLEQSQGDGSGEGLGGSELIHDTEYVGFGERVYNRLC